MNRINWGNKEVLVCGGAGFVGSHLATELVKLGARVTVVDNLSSGSKQNVKEVKDNIRFEEKDLRDFRVCRKLVASKDCVFQLAANMGGIGYITAIGADIMRDSATININMIDAARIHETPMYFYSSSACVYPNYLQKETAVKPLREVDAIPADPDQFYGWEKLFTEKLCEAYMQDYKMNIRMVRFHNIFGPCYTAYDSLKGKAPAHMIVKAIKHPNPPYLIWGDGKQTRSFLYIDDCVQAVLRLMDTDHKEAINIGSDQLISMKALADMAVVLSGKKGVKYEYDLSKPQGVRGRNADLNLMKEVLMWEPQVSLEKGMEITYNWAVEHYGELEGL